MLRSINPDAENVAPNSAARPARRKDSKRGLGLRPAGLSNIPAKQFGKQPAKQPARRRALGDITNKGRPSAVKKTPLVKSAPHTRFTPNEEQVEDPDIFPEPLPREPYEPVLEFDDSELAQLAKMREEAQVDGLKDWANRVDELEMDLPEVSMPRYDEEDEEVSDMAFMEEDVPFHNAELLGAEGFEALELS